MEYKLRGDIRYAILSPDPDLSISLSFPTKLIRTSTIWEKNHARLWTELADVKTTVEVDRFCDRLLQSGQKSLLGTSFRNGMTRTQPANIQDARVWWSAPVSKRREVGEVAHGRQYTGAAAL